MIAQTAAGIIQTGVFIVVRAGLAAVIGHSKDIVPPADLDYRELEGVAIEREVAQKHAVSGRPVYIPAQTQVIARGIVIG